MKSRILIYLLSTVVLTSAFTIPPENMLEKAGTHLEKVSDSLDLNFVAKPLEAKDYFAEKCKKNQAVLHHTASGKGIDGDYNHFLNPGHIGTSDMIAHDGTIYKLFSDEFWAYHLGVTKAQFKALGLPYMNLNKNSIGVEIDSWGPLKKINGLFYTYINDWGQGKLVDRRGNQLRKVVPESEIITYENGFRGYDHFEAYTDKQIDSVCKDLKYLSIKHDIDVSYKDDIFEYNMRAMRGEEGLFTHCSYREDKTDIHPQPNLIEALKAFS